MKPLLAVAMLGVTHASVAQPDAASPLSGRVLLGTRGLDVDGAETKYREDVNLDDGVRIFDVSLAYEPSAGDGGFVDRVEFDAANLGGDPFETMHLGVRKFGAFDLRLDRRRSEYFYRDVLLPETLASVTGSTGGDYHHFDFERVHDTARLDIDVTPATKLKLGLERFTRTGDNTTTLDLQRDEFELDRPLDESSNALAIGVQHSWKKVTLIVEQQNRDFENTTGLFLPGASAGLNTSDPAQISFFALDESYDLDSRGHHVRVLGKPTARLDLQAAWHRDDLELDLTAAERSAGTTFTGAPFATDLGGFAAVDRDIELEELEIGYAVTDRIRLKGALGRRTLAQRGAVTFGESGDGLWDIETRAFEAGLEYAISPSLVTSVGWSEEERNTREAWALGTGGTARRQETERDGFFATLTFGRSTGLKISASIEDNASDDPFTLASPTDGRRYRVSGRYRWDNGLALTGSQRRTQQTNDLSGWSGDTEQTDLRLSYQSADLSLSVGYALVELDRNIVQRVTAGTRQDLFAIDYAADTRFFDVSARWQAADRVALGAAARQYDNDGSFPLRREDFRGFVEIDLRDGHLVQISYRTLEHTEDVFDDYDAELLELGFGLRW